MIDDAKSMGPHGWEQIVWPDSLSPDGVVTYQLASWFGFHDFLETEVFNPSSGSKHKYVWRGQRRSNWPLSSTLDRLFAKLGMLDVGLKKLEEKSQIHFESFKHAARGRRGLNPAHLPTEHLWALGQHFGLATPLLDWTRSPFAAAYFAFEELSLDPTENRVVYGLDQKAVERKNAEIEEAGVDLKGERVVKFIDPMSDENPRLVSQAGLFTQAPVGESINDWVANAFEDSSAPVLLRILIPNSDRLGCLRALDRMNINHLSLFPDLSGATRFANLKLELES